MLPEAAEAIKIADEHLAGKSVERRKALALDIQQAIIRHAGRVAEDAISQALAEQANKTDRADIERERATESNN